MWSADRAVACGAAQNLTKGCKVYFPVFVEGAKLSMGDMHFSQGDGEVSFCGAIEMSGFLDLKCAPTHSDNRAQNAH